MEPQEYGLMSTECTRTKLIFQGLDGRDVVGRFDGGEITSDARRPLARGGAADPDPGSSERVLHRRSGSGSDRAFAVEAQVKHGVYGLCLGYEDLNDHDELCRDGCWRCCVIGTT